MPTDRICTYTSKPCDRGCRMGEECARFKRAPEDITPADTITMPAAEFNRLLDERDSWRRSTVVLSRAVVEFLSAVDTQHDTKEPPLKYTVPWGALNVLRTAVSAR